jgi:hypothetical protein
MQLGAMLDGEGQVGEHILDTLVDEALELRPPAMELVAEVVEAGPRGRLVRLLEGLAQPGGDHRLLGARHVGERVPGPMHAASLPRRAEHASDRGLEPFVGIRDDEPHAGEPALDQVTQEVGPEDLRLRRADV